MEIEKPIQPKKLEIWQKILADEQIPSEYFF